MMGKLAVHMQELEILSAGCPKALSRGQGHLPLRGARECEGGGAHTYASCVEARVLSLLLPLTLCLIVYRVSMNWKLFVSTCLLAGESALQILLSPPYNAGVLDMSSHVQLFL